MKKKFNVLSAIVFVVLAINLAAGFYYAALGFTEGIRSAMNECETGGDGAERHAPAMISFLPTELLTMPDSVTNTVTGEKTGAMAAHLMVRLDRETTGGAAGIVTSILSVFICVILLLVIWHFIHFIRNINRMEIFTWKNVNLLETMGGLLLAVFVANLANSLITYWQVSRVFALEGRVFDFFTPLTDSTLILGVLAMITGEVFAMGLKLREEQELTI